MLTLVCVVLGMYTKDKKAESSVLVDRATGGASIKDGEIELMLYRRTCMDDSRGVEESLAETVCVNNSCSGLTIRGNYHVSINRVGEGARWRRETGQGIYSPLVMAFTHENKEKWKASTIVKGHAMDPLYTLPPNIALITLQELELGNVLLRLANLYEAREDSGSSKLAKVELKKLFPGKISHMNKDHEEDTLATIRHPYLMSKLPQMSGGECLDAGFGQPWFQRSCYSSREHLEAPSSVPKTRSRQKSSVFFDGDRRYSRLLSPNIDTVDLDLARLSLMDPEHISVHEESVTATPTKADRDGCPS